MFFFLPEKVSLLILKLCAIFVVIYLSSQGVAASFKMECQLLGHLFDIKTIITKCLVSVGQDQEMVYGFYLKSCLGECIIRYFLRLHILLSLII